MNISNVFFLLRSILIDAATTQFTREFRGINLLGQNNSLDLFIAFLSLFVQDFSSTYHLSPTKLAMNVYL